MQVRLQANAIALLVELLQLAAVQRAHGQHVNLCHQLCVQQHGRDFQHSRILLTPGQHDAQPADGPPAGGSDQRRPLPALAGGKEDIQLAVPLQGGVQAAAAGVFEYQLHLLAVGQFVQQAPGVGGHQAVALGEVVAQQAALTAPDQGNLGGERQLRHLLQADILQQQAQQATIQLAGQFYHGLQGVAGNAVQVDGDQDRTPRDGLSHHRRCLPCPCWRTSSPAHPAPPGAA